MIRSSAAELVSRGKRTGGGGDPEDLSLGTRLDDGDDDDGARPDKTLPWPARNKEGKRNKIAEAFHLG